MRIGYSPEQEELRRELRSYFSRLMTPERTEALSSVKGEYGTGNAYRDTVAQMGRDGWLTLSWPTEYGGQARSAMDQLIFTDEAAIAGAPVPFLTINSVAPTIMAFGTDEQKKFYLPRIASGDLHFSIGYSEPGAGTDLAALRTSAVRDGDDYVINGQKMWTSLIPYADYVWLAVRTNPEAKKHRGISMLIVPTDAPGFSWTPVHTMAGVDTSATYYQDVRVPVGNLVGEENGGWKLVTNQLNHERVALVSAQPIFVALGAVREWAQNTKDARGSRLIDSEWVQLNLARVHAKAEVLKLINWELASSDDAAPSPADASAAKVFGTELATEAYRLLMEVLGTAATLRPDSPGALLRGRVERMHRSCLILTFGGGTNEIQRDIIGMVALGLPRTSTDGKDTRRFRHGFLRTDRRPPPDLRRAGRARSPRRCCTPEHQRELDGLEHRAAPELTSLRATVRPRPVAQADRRRHPVRRRAGVVGRRRFRGAGAGRGAGRAGPPAVGGAVSGVGRARCRRAGEVRIRCAAAGVGGTRGQWREDPAVALDGEMGEGPVQATASGDGYRLTGSRTLVGYGPVADAFLVPAETAVRSQRFPGSRRRPRSVG